LRAPLDFQNDLRQIHLRTKRNGGGIRWVHGGVGSGRGRNEGLRSSK
jgi:hypothetical protein